MWSTKRKFTGNKGNIEKKRTLRIGGEGDKDNKSEWREVRSAGNFVKIAIAKKHVLREAN